MIIFKPWKTLLLQRDEKQKTLAMKTLADQMRRYFQQQLALPKSGRLYRRRGRVRQASAPGEYPASDTGALSRSVKSFHTANSAGVGTNKFYSGYLRDGTTLMERRKMSDDVLKETAPQALQTLRGWIRFRYG